MHAIAPLLIALFASQIEALALPRPDMSGCKPGYEYENLAQSEPYKLPKQLVTGISCTSSLGSSCEISKTYAHSVSVEYSVSVSLSTGLQLTEVFSLGLEVGFSYAWGTSDETAQGVAIECPPGGIECGVMAVDTVVDVSGRVREAPLEGMCNPNTNWQDFKVVAPVLEGKADENSPVVNFQACVKSCGSAEFPDSCNVAYQEHKLPQCPIEGLCEGSFGGVCGSIPISQAGQPVV